jgi:Na+(H+)/acetate symporter ActP
MFGQGYPRAPAGGLVVTLEEPTLATFPEAATVVAGGHEITVEDGEEVLLPEGRVELPAGTAVPVAEGTDAQTGSEWAEPVSDEGDASPLFVYSLLIATFLGTMGLPHILVRFYTNRDGPAARRTTVRVLGLLGLFYAFPAVYGALGRVLVPELYLTGETDTVVLRLPEAAWPGLGGELLGALVAAGAFAAFMSTASGLLVSLAGTATHDFRRGVRRDAAARRLRFRLGALGAMVVPALLALIARDLDISVLVGWAFALAASTFCPLLLLGIWWDKLTARGAACGLAVGAIAATTAIFSGLAFEPAGGTLDALLTQPAVLSVPLAFATMALVSLTDRSGRRAPTAELLSLHAPEGLGLGLPDEDADPVRA